MTATELRILKLLGDIYGSARKIHDRLQGETKESFLGEASPDLQDAIARRLTIIGEASAALLRKHPDFCEAHPEIPLKQARGMRNTIVHDYDGVLWDLVWGVAMKDIPELITVLEPFLSAEESKLRSTDSMRM